MTMQAVRIVGPDAVRLEQIEIGALAAGEVRVRVRATGICGTDLEILDGTMPYYTRGMTSYPVTPGHEWAGEVAEVGLGVTGFDVGDHVVGECSVGCAKCDECRSGAYHRCPNRTETGILNRDGGFAEYLVFPARYLHRVNKDLDIKAAALVEPTAVAFNGLKLGGFSHQDNLVIFGDGPIGLLLLLVARVMTKRKIALVGAHTDRMQLAKSLGAGTVIDARTENVADRLRNTFDGSLPDVAVEATGQPQAAAMAVGVVKPGGRVVLQGLFGGRVLKDFELDHVVINDLTLRGALGSPNVWPEVIALIEAGHVKPLSIVTHELGLSQFTQGIDLVKSREAVKVLITQFDDPSPGVS